VPAVTQGQSTSSALGQSEDEAFGPKWASRKLDMPRRRRELIGYIKRWLTELREMEPGLVVDVGCGPGDLLDLCREMGHSIVGIDARCGRGGMGDPYLSQCRIERKKLRIPVLEIGMSQFKEGGQDRGPLALSGQAVCINLRGSIEQCYADFMLGDPHHLHHDCRRLDWDIRIPDFRRLCFQAERLLRVGGILMIAANGTRSTDRWYDAQIREAAEHSGLKLIDHDGLLFHKWVKTEAA
jgi:SAM-dependent methyltransferase